MIVDPALAAHENTRHGFFARTDGHSTGLYAGLNCGFGSGDNPETVAANRAIIAQKLGVPLNQLLSVYQVHSPNVVHVTQAWDRRHAPKADAMVTEIPDMALGILTADCAPVLFADADAGVIGAAHAGWQGAFGGVLEATIDAMENLGASRAGITAVIGPTISARNYEVGPEFQERFVIQDSFNTKFFTPSGKPGHFMFDLPAYGLYRLERAGVTKCSWTGDCTYADEDRFYSYRRTTHRAEPDYGRLLSAIVLGGGE